MLASTKIQKSVSNPAGRVVAETVIETFEEDGSERSVDDCWYEGGGEEIRLETSRKLGCGTSFGLILRIGGEGQRPERKPQGPVTECTRGIGAVQVNLEL